MVFFVRCASRFDRDQYSWRARSRQMMRRGHFRIASNLFPLGVLGLFGGHVMGLVAPEW